MIFYTQRNYFWSIVFCSWHIGGASDPRSTNSHTEDPSLRMVHYGTITYAVAHEYGLTHNLQSDIFDLIRSGVIGF